MYVAICFVHERYMALLPLFFMVLLFRRAKEWKLWLAPLGGFAFVQLLRLVSIGTVSPAGTGGTDVADTLSIGSVLHFAMSQIAYLFGINAGPEHLNGQNFREAPMSVMLLIAVADLMLVLLVVAFFIRLVQRRKRCIGYLKTSVLFIFFIGACIASSSVTIRVEMRWVYVSYAAALLFLAWIYGVLTEGMAYKGRWMQAVPYLSMITVDVYKRQIYNGAPIVTTSIGAEGIPQVEDVLLVEDTPEQFAETVVRLYQDDEACRELCGRT